MRVVLEMPPIFARLLPLPGSAAEHRSEVCKAKLRALAAGRASTAFLDLRVDTPLTRDIGNFVDRTHYKAEVAQFAEGRIAETAATLARASGTH